MQGKRSCFWLFPIPEQELLKREESQKIISDHVSTKAQQTGSQEKAAEFPVMFLGKQSPVTQSQNCYLLPAHGKQIK